ncbi:ABC transporter ATP-binding protein [Lentzea tibetensis]|uniref:ABC transporter ATP-binding protein n=1 Tax=Lentzea tibetensis TaxID=2591470 RepID=A0A563F382_9PSEU|nr:ABC transporter ATP-binding protein [Lentzea tibetensis]
MLTGVRVRGLTVAGVPSGAPIVDSVDLDVRPGEILGLVGESGSGKTTLGLALLAYYKRGTQLAGGSVAINGVDLAGAAVRRMRGDAVAYIPQSPASALNPALRIRTQLGECGGDDARVREVLREVALPDTDVFLRRYPHQLSGGQQQRVAIAMAFLGRPDLIVLDEPTTGLDVTTQKHVLETVRKMCATYSCAAVYITHDMAVVAELTDRIAVMYSGRVVETGPARTVLRSPQHPYTARLLMAVPDLDGRREIRGIPGHAPSPVRRPAGCAFAPRCPLVVDRCRDEVPALEDGVRCFRAGVSRFEVVERVEVPVVSADAALEVRGLSAWYGSHQVLEDISLSVPRGQCVALLGESGSGKTTLARAIAGLHPRHGGEVVLGGESLPPSGLRRTPLQRRRIQYVFQNPYESLNPRKTVRELVLAPARVLLGKVPDGLVEDALSQAALSPELASRYPDQLSGGERQRVAIARALAAQPEVLVCDEVTSALDVSVQAAIVELIAGLRERKGLTLLFVTHDIALVRTVAQHVAVLEHGRIVERGPVAEVLAAPEHPYTQALMADTPRFDTSRFSQ